MTDREFGGKPVTGDYTHSSFDITDGDPQDFLASLDALFKHDDVLAISWTQYTPYFNDGEACVFNAYEPQSIRLKSALENQGEYDEAEEYFGEEAGWVDIWGALTDYTYQSTPTGYVKVPKEGWVRPEWADTVKAVNPGAYETSLLETFGDHAKVVATRDGFEVEYYDHD